MSDINATLEYLTGTDDEVVQYTVNDGGNWIAFTNGPLDVPPTLWHSFKTAQGKEWDVMNGWRDTPPVPSGYTEEELEKDNPFNAFLNTEGVDDIPEAKKPLVIYHANCADGFSAAWCFWNAQRDWGMDFDFHPGVYSEAPPDVTGRDVYLVDFSYKRAVVEEMLKTVRHLFLIDHHKTAIDDLQGINNPKFTPYTDLERSGAMLAWDYLHNASFDTGLEGAVYHKYTIQPHNPGYSVPPLLLNHIQDRDLWKFKLAGTREISAEVFSWEYTFENWDKLMKADQAELLKMTVAGAALERKHHKDIAELVKVCQRYMVISSLETDDDGAPVQWLVPVASLPYTLTSDAGHLMAKNHEGGTQFAACYWDTASHRIFSLRSTENGMDVSEIAKYYGGGGHKNAAGFRVPRDHILARS